MRLTPTPGHRKNLMKCPEKIDFFCLFNLSTFSWPIFCNFNFYSRKLKQNFFPTELAKHEKLQNSLLQNGSQWTPKTVLCLNHRTVLKWTILVKKDNNFAVEKFPHKYLIC